MMFVLIQGYIVFNQRGMLMIALICLQYIKQHVSTQCWTDFWDRKSSAKISLGLLRAGQPSWGFQGKTWVEWWVNKSSASAFRAGSYSRFSSARERSVSRIPEAVSEVQCENALEEMKAAVNLCQQCQEWGVCSLWSREEHVFIIVCHPSAEEGIFSLDLFSLPKQIWCNSRAFYSLASTAAVHLKLFRTS